MSFLDFVAIKRNQASEDSLEFKTMTSYLNSSRCYEGMSMEDSLRVWIANMIDCGFTVSSRRRYVEKLGSIYKEYLNGAINENDPFGKVKDLRNFEAQKSGKELRENSIKLARIFDSLMIDAKNKPELAVFLYLLFNGSSDLESAISLTAENYVSVYPQLDEIIKPEDFHHRRRYVFALNQSRKRMSQLKKEVTGLVDIYLSYRGIKFLDGFSNKTIVALWAERARRIGIKLSELKEVLSIIPAEYEYLRYISGTELSQDSINAIYRKVAESFSPSIRRWYAIRLRKGVDYDDFQKSIKKGFAENYDERTLFYPQSVVTKRVDKKIISETIPVIPDVVFINVLPRHVSKIDRLIKLENFGWIFRSSRKPDSEYSAIDSQSMFTFQRVVGSFTPDMKISLTKESPIGIGREVRITGGIMEGYTGQIYDIKDDSDVRQIFIRLSPDYSIRAEIKIEEYFVELIDNQPTTSKVRL